MTQPSPTTSAPWQATPPPLPDLEVGAWTDLDRLPAALDALDLQARRVVRLARSEVCDPRGLEPSPLCVLRPLVPVLEAVEEAFADLGRVLGREVDRLRCGVVAARAELGAADTGAVEALGTLAGPGSV